jgi:hypothetical protein
MDIRRVWQAWLCTALHTGEKRFILYLEVEKKEASHVWIFCSGG